MAFLNNTGLERLWSKITAKLDLKVDKVSGKGLSTNDYTTTEKNKLAGIATGATKVTVDSALSSSSTNPVQNKVVNTAISELQSSLNNKLEKTTYEYNRTLAFGSSGKLCIGKFPCYDSNISVEMTVTTTKTYSGTLVIATQNINASSGGTYEAVVYGDEDNTLTNLIKIERVTGSNVFAVYMNVPQWSKHILHIQCAALPSSPTDIATEIASIPSTATIVPSNAFIHTHNYAGSSSAGGAANSAVKLATARSINVDTALRGTATSFDGSSNITIPVTAVKEAYLSWGGKNHEASFGCLDTAMVPELGANRLAFGNAAGITIQYSIDGGSAWYNYNPSDSAKVGLFSDGYGFRIGRADKSTLTANCMLRVIIDTDAFGIYTVLNKFVILATTNGCDGCYCTIDASLEKSYTTFTTLANKVPIGGWPNYNVINVSDFTTYYNEVATQYGLIRFTFGCTSVNTNYNGLTIMKIMGFGGIGWNTPSTMAKTGHLYSYDSSQNATFPAKVTATEFVGSLANVKCDVIYAGNTSSAISFDPTQYDLIVVMGNIYANQSSSDPLASVVCGTQANKGLNCYYSFSDEAYYYKFYLNSSGISARQGGTGSILTVFGVKLG